MDDYIKRQDVLDAIWLVDPQNDGSDGGTVVLQNLELTSLKSAKQKETWVACLMMDTRQK